MKKALLLIGLLICVGSVNAATISNSKYENGRITLSGTGTGQVQIVLFDKDNEPVYMATANVVNGEYSFTLPQIANLEDGEYNIRVADYDGSNPAAKEITIANSNVVNPGTGDNIILFIVIGVICLIGIVGGMIYLKKKNLKKNDLHTIL